MSVHNVSESFISLSFSSSVWSSTNSCGRVSEVVFLFQKCPQGEASQAQGRRFRDRDVRGDRVRLFHCPEIHEDRRDFAWETTSLPARCHCWLVGMTLRHIHIFMLCICDVPKTCGIYKIWPQHTRYTCVRVLIKCVCVDTVHLRLADWRHLCQTPTVWEFWLKQLSS